MGWTWEEVDFRDGLGFCLLRCFLGDKLGVVCLPAAVLASWDANWTFSMTFYVMSKLFFPPFPKVLFFYVWTKCLFFSFFFLRKRREWNEATCLDAGQRCKGDFPRCLSSVREPVPWETGELWQTFVHCWWAKAPLGAKSTQGNGDWILYRDRIWYLCSVW